DQKRRQAVRHCVQHELREIVGCLTSLQNSSVLRAPSGSYLDDLAAGASLHINTSPYQQAPRVLLCWRASPRTGAPRFVEFADSANVQHAGCQHTQCKSPSSPQQTGKLDERPVGLLTE